MWIREWLIGENQTFEDFALVWTKGDITANADCAAHITLGKIHQLTGIAVAN